MNKVELVASMAEKSGLRKVEAEKALDAFVASVEEELANKGEIRLVGFGTFLISRRAASEGRNPKTGAPISIPARNIPKFRPGKQLRDAVETGGTA
ncbi:MAG: HU family DNA-binding protein [Holosporales bacterium]|nr:HU family DNA-binding protein [Holosporales bacterium]